MSQSHLLLAAACLMLLTACGQSGDLVLPDRKPTPRATAPTRPATPAPPSAQPPSEDSEPAPKKDASTAVP